MAMSRGTIRVGLSGWTFAPWRGGFYPPSLPRQHELHFAANCFATLEINDTFYATQSAETFRLWRAQVTGGFQFAVRGPRTVTHTLRLRAPEPALGCFFASGVLLLGPHLGPILWRLPSNLAFDPDRLNRFVDLLPTDTYQAADLADRHDTRLLARPWMDLDRNRPLRHALEIDHDSYRDPCFLRLLRERNIALVCNDAAIARRFAPMTADFVYCRLHAAADYDGPSLTAWATRTRQWAQGTEAEATGRRGLRRRDVFIYLDTIRRHRAPANALELVRRLRA